MKKGHKLIHGKDSIRFMREVIGAGKWQIEVLSNSLSLDLKEVPRKYKEQNNMSAVKNMSGLKEKVKEWEEEGYIERLSEPAWCCNPMSVAAKYDPVKDETKLRPCIDLSRHVNKCTRVSHAKLDDLTVAQDLIIKDDFVASFDLANQFFHVKLHEADKKFLAFELPGMNGEQEYYWFTVMASPAVEVITRLLRSLKVYLHQLGIKLSLYVDDGKVSAGTKEKTWSQFQFVLTVSQLCGWDIQWKKTSTEAVQQLQHLGFLTDSVQLRYCTVLRPSHISLKSVNLHSVLDSKVMHSFTTPMRFSQSSVMMMDTSPVHRIWHAKARYASDIHQSSLYQQRG